MLQLFCGLNNCFSANFSLDSGKCMMMQWSVDGFTAGHVDKQADTINDQGNNVLVTLFVNSGRLKAGNDVENIENSCPLSTVESGVIELMFYPSQNPQLNCQFQISFVCF